MNRATIFNIQRFSVADGPGTRSTVFFKGCNLRCMWCHNPESFLSRPQIEINPDKCIGCGDCISACPQKAHRFVNGNHTIDRSLCTGCGACADGCYAEALVLAGRSMTVEEVMAELLEDELLYRNSGGGVTCSGGECMLQLDFLEELLKALKGKGIHTAVDTAGNVPKESFERILPYTDLFLYDVKAGFPETHEALTGSDNRRILENLDYLVSKGAGIRIRIPFIPELNGSEKELREMAGILHKNRIYEADLLRYHRLGEGKYHALEMDYKLEGHPAPSKSDAAEAIAIFKEFGVKINLQ